MYKETSTVDEMGISLNVRSRVKNVPEVERFIQKIN